MFNIFNSKYGGYIKKLKVNKFWNTLNNEERTIAKETFAKTFYPDSFNTEQIDGTKQKVKTNLSSSDFLYNIGVRLANKKNYLLAEKFLLETLNKEKNLNRRHEILTTLIDVYYKQRDSREDAIDKCVHFCLKDIKLVQKIQQKEQEIPSFKRLAIIYETREKFNEAIKISELALKFGLSDGTKNGYKGRIDKLKTKLTN